MRHSFGTSLVLAGLCALAGAPQTLAQNPGFRGLGDLPGGVYHSEASAISGDGSTVGGWSSSAASSPGENQAFKWTGGTMTSLADLPGGLVRGMAGALSYDGQWIVGDSASADGGQAVIWQPDGTIMSLGALVPTGPMGTARGITDDGSVVVGSCLSPSGWQAFRWTASGGLIGMGDLAGGAFNSAAQTVNDDLVIFGTGTGTPGPSAFRWTLTGGMVSLGDLPGGGFFSEPYAVTPDATVMVGRGMSTASGTERFEAIRWTQAGGLEGLGDLPGGVFESFALDLSDDGLTVIGFGTSALGQEAMVWTREQGMRRLVDALTGIDGPPSGWFLTAATAISGDGRVIVGNGINPAGQTEAWIWTLPPPPEIPTVSTWGLIVMALALLIGASLMIGSVATRSAYAAAKLHHAPTGP